MKLSELKVQLQPKGHIFFAQGLIVIVVVGSRISYYLMPNAKDGDGDLTYLGDAVISSPTDKGQYRITNLYVNKDKKIVVEYDDTPT